MKAWKEVYTGKNFLNTLDLTLEDIFRADTRKRYSGGLPSPKYFRADVGRVSSGVRRPMSILGAGVQLRQLGR